MKRLLLVSFYFPPARGSGVYRIRAWANEFAARGWDVRVLTVEDGYYDDVIGDADTALLSTIDPRVRQVSFRYPHEHLVTDISRMSWTHAHFPGVHRGFWDRTSTRFFPEVHGHVVPAMVTRGARQLLTWRPDVVVATGNPYAQFEAARRLSRLARVPLVVDFHDAWTLDQFSELDAFPAGSPQREAEGRILRDASLFCTVNRPLVQWYGQAHSEAADRMRYVPNGWEPDSIPDPGPRLPSTPPAVGYVGTVRSDLPLEEFAAGWALATADPALAGATMDVVGHLGFRSHGSASLRARLDRPGWTYRGPVSQGDLVQVYRGLDVLALLTPSSRFVTAGKVYDYMASGRVVLGVFDPRNDTTAALADYPAFVPVADLSPESIADGLRRACELAATMTPALHGACREHALAHTWSHALAPVIDEIEAMTA